jgi:hypothetical protein
MKKLLLLLFVFLVTLSARAYYLDQAGSLFHEDGRYTGYSGVAEISLNFHKNEYGFVLMKTGTLFLAEEINGFLSVSRNFVAVNVDEIDYPYYIRQNNLYIFNPVNHQSLYLQSGLIDLCLGTVKENPVTEFSFAYLLNGTKLIRINQERLPKECID